MSTYESMAGHEGVVVQHGQTLRAVAGGAVDLTPTAGADITGGVRHLPAVDEHPRVLALTNRGAIG